MFPNVVILARREDDTGPWTRVGELEMRGSWYVPIAYSNQAIGVKIMSILITLGQTLVFKAIRQKIVEEHYGFEPLVVDPIVEEKQVEEEEKLNSIECIYCAVCMRRKFLR